MPGPSLRKIWALCVVSQDPRVNDKAFRVYARLLDRFNVNTGVCFPGKELMAAELSCSDKTIQNALRLLENLGYIDTSINGGPRRQNLYRVWLPDGKIEFKKAEESVQSMKKKSSTKPKKMKKEKLNREFDGSRRRSDCDHINLVEKVPELEHGQVRERLEKAAAERLGNGADAWASLMACEDLMPDLTQQVIEGTLKFGDAVNTVMLATTNGDV